MKSRRDSAAYPVQQIIPILLMVTVVLFSVAVRIRLLDFPLERDEGEYARAGQLMLQGIPPYQLLYNMKLPGIYAAYALIMAICGQTVAGIHLGLTVVTVATTAMVFLLAKRLLDLLGATIAAATFALLALSPALLGLAGHATHFVLLPALAGFLLLLNGVERNRRSTLFFSGLLFGVAFLMKQHGVFFGLFGGLYLVNSEMRKRPRVWPRIATQGALYSAGVLLPFGLTCLLLHRAGVFDTFWFWTVSYARQYVGIVPFETAFHYFSTGFAGVLRSGLWLWVLAGGGVVTLLIRWKAHRNSLFIAGLFLFSLLSICPGFYFRQHYFILLLPATGIAVGLVASAAAQWISKSRPGESPLGVYVTAALFALACGHAVFTQRDVLCVLPPEEACRVVYGANPFPEAVRIAEYIRQHTPEDATIAVIGSEPEIHFHARRKSATGHVYMYGLMEPQPYATVMQEQMIREIEAAEPDVVVFVNVSTSWLAREESNKLVFDWFSRYVKETLQPVGLVDILPSGPTRYHWDLDTQRRRPESPHSVVIYRRKR